MRSIVFSNYLAKDTRRLGATIDVEHSHVRFLGNLTLNLWDCGGQDAFMDNYLTSQRDHIFKNVQILIYVFDVESREFDKDLATYVNCLEALYDNSPKATVFCLIHKMDLVQEEMRTKVFEERKAVLQAKSKSMRFVCQGTSIWDETLYHSWSEIVRTLVPNTPILQSQLKELADNIDAEEAVLFEKTTFLVISEYTRAPHHDPHRFEKISTIIKQFKQSCSKISSQFQSLELRGAAFSAFIDALTTNTLLLIIISNAAGENGLTLVNIASARKHFEKIESYRG